MSNKCSSKCWWRCGIPSLEHIDPSVQEQLFSKPFWFLEQDCDSECYCTTDDNLNEDCEIGQIKYGNCLDYTQWNTTSYHEPCKDLSPPQTECGDGCCDTTNGSKVCCNNQCVLSDKCCGNKVLGLDEECCDDKIVKKCRRFQSPDGGDSSIQSNTNCGGNPCGPGNNCGCPDGQTCCTDDDTGEKKCLAEGDCCGGLFSKNNNRVCCNKKLCGSKNTALIYDCVGEPGQEKCCLVDKINTELNTCCKGSTFPCAGRCCKKSQCLSCGGGPPECQGCEKDKLVQPPLECNSRCRCTTKLERPCGCYSCLPNENCLNAPSKVGGKYCCPGGSVIAGIGNNQIDCCPANRAAPQQGPVPLCCPKGEKGCSDGKCRKRCYTCGDQECDDNESCCPGGGCYKRRDNVRCCFGGTPLAHTCPSGLKCCGKGACCGSNEICCGSIDDVSKNKCIPAATMKCCVPFGPCMKEQRCCGRECCEANQQCINGPNGPTCVSPA